MVTPGESILITLYDRGEGSKLCAYVTFYNESDKWHVEQKPLKYPGNDWKAESFTVKIPEGAVTAGVKFRNKTATILDLADVRIQTKNMGILPDVTRCGLAESYFTDIYSKSVVGRKDDSPSVPLNTNFDSGASWKRYAGIGMGDVFEPNTAYKLSYTFKSDATCYNKTYNSYFRIHFSEKYYDFCKSSTVLNDWIDDTICFVTPATISSADKIEILTLDPSQEGDTLTICNVVLTKDTSFETFTQNDTELAENAVVSEGTVNVKHHFLGDPTTADASTEKQPKMHLIAALYKKDGNTSKLVSVIVGERDIWQYHKNGKTKVLELAKPSDASIDLAIPARDAGEYVIKLMTWDIGGGLEILEDTYEHQWTVEAPAV